MAHKFFKTASANLGVPSRLSDDMFGRIKKTAHHIWNVSRDGENVTINRLKAETAANEFDVGIQPTQEMLPGTIVTLFMAGNKITAMVQGSNEAGLVLSTGTGLIEGVGASWVRRAQRSDSAQYPWTPEKPDIGAKPQRHPDVNMSGTKYPGLVQRIIDDIKHSPNGHATITLGGTPGARGNATVLDVTKSGETYHAKIVLMVTRESTQLDETFDTVEELADAVGGSQAVGPQELEDIDFSRSKHRLQLGEDYYNKKQDLDTRSEKDREQVIINRDQVQSGE